MVIWPLDGSASGNDAGYRAAFECAAECIFMVDSKLEIVEANHSCARAFGWPSGMFAPMQLERLISHIVYLRELPADPSFVVKPRREAC